MGWKVEGCDKDVYPSPSKGNQNGTFQGSPNMEHSKGHQA